MTTLTVKQAVDRVNGGQDLRDCTLDPASLQRVSVQDALVLSRGGIVVPEENLFYDDGALVPDEEIDGLVRGREITGMSWADKARLGTTPTTFTLTLELEDPELLARAEAQRELLERVVRGVIGGLGD